MPIHDKSRPHKKQGPAREQMIKIWGPRSRGETTITKTTLIFLLIFWGIFFGVIFAFGNFCLDCTPPKALPNPPPSPLPKPPPPHPPPPPFSGPPPTTTADVGNVTKGQQFQITVSHISSVQYFQAVCLLGRKLGGEKIRALWSAGRAARSLVCKGLNPRPSGATLWYPIATTRSGGGSP